MKQACLLLNLCIPVLAFCQARPHKAFNVWLCPAKDTVACIKPKPLPPNFYQQNTGYFCKKEWQLQKKTGVAFRFRLGLAAYCDQLEGKRRF
jgi:hypothetical protein